MGIDGNSAAVVGARDEAVGRKLDLDPVGVAGDRLIHAVVDHLREEVVETFFVGAAYVHAGPAPNGLQTLDVGGGVSLVADRLLQRNGIPAPRDGGDRLQVADLLVEGGEEVLFLA